MSKKSILNFPTISKYNVEYITHYIQRLFSFSHTKKFIKNSTETQPKCV